MTEPNKPDTRYHTAPVAAAAAIEALLTIYWADSFNADLLLDRLAETILFFIRNARSLKELHPYPNLLDEGDDQSIARQFPSDLRDGASNNVSGH